MGSVPEKKKATLKLEALPSPHGERIMPRIEHLKQKAEAAAAAKERKAVGGGRGKTGAKVGSCFTNSWLYVMGNCADLQS